MSVVRRFFCLFVTFDLIFVGLLWLICVVITGENIYKALEEQVLNYTIEKSLFDVVVAAAARFIILIFFYGILQINHWIIIASTTTLSCCFLITKVIWYTWPPAQQPVFQVLLIIISFVISWFEAWFLDSRMIPQEEYSRTLTDGNKNYFKF
jgi:StAR-related lipid transfer protein 3